MNTILFVDSGGGHGGSISYLYSFLKYIDRSRFQPVVIMYYFSDAHLVNKIRDLGIEVIFLNTGDRGKQGNFEQVKNQLLLKVLKYCYFFITFVKKYVPAIIKLVELIKNKKVKIILLGSEVDFNIPAVIAAKVSRVPCIVRKSGTGTAPNNLVRRILTYFVDIFIASSNAEMHTYTSSRLPSKKVIRIYEGVDLSYFGIGLNGTKIRSEFGIPGNSILIGSVSRLEVGKGHDDLILAASLVVSNCPDVVFMVVGDDFDSKGGCLRKEIEDRVSKLGISNNVIFTGWRNDISDILHSIDIFVHCPNSWLEGMGIATLEALACGKPVVITNNCGLAETTINGYNGFVNPIGDYEALANSIICLCEDKELRLRMGRNSRLRAEAVFDIRNNVLETEQVLLEHIKH